MSIALPFNRRTIAKNSTSFIQHYLIAVFISLIAIFTFVTYDVNAQGVGINPSGNPPDASAIFDASATNKGLLVPRLTTAQRDAIPNPAQALQIYNTTTKCFEFWE